jgi:hypothetical protein
MEQMQKGEVSLGGKMGVQHLIISLP